MCVPSAAVPVALLECQYVFWSPELLDQKKSPAGPFMKKPPGYLKKFSMKACRYRVVNGSPMLSMYS